MLNTNCNMQHNKFFILIYNKYIDKNCYCLNLTKCSNVFGISRIALTPEHTTATGVCPSSFKSALISILNST